MFPRRLFAARIFPPRLWPESAGEGATLSASVSFTIDITYSATADVGVVEAPFGGGGYGATRGIYTRGDAEEAERRRRAKSVARATPPEPEAVAEEAAEARAPEPEPAPAPRLPAIAAIGPVGAARVQVPAATHRASVTFDAAPTVQFRARARVIRAARVEFAALTTEYFVAQPIRHWGSPTDEELVAILMAAV